MDTNIKEKIIEELKTLPVYIRQGSRQHVVRCPYCGDSSNLTHGHFSIRIDPTDPTDPLLYRCFKCENSGLFTTDTMNDLGLTIDSDVAKGLSKIIYRSCKINKITSLMTEDNIIPAADMTRPLTIEKLNYIKDRLGFEITQDLIQSLGIVVNFDEFLTLNKIPFHSGITVSYIKFLTSNYVGFLSKNKNQIVFRCIRNDPNMQRYRKVILNIKNLDPNNYYGIKNSIDILYTNDINIHIAEGTFDIISVFQNLNHGDLENNYYFAACGFGMRTVIRNSIKMGLNTNLNVHIYADKDKSDKEIIDSIRQYDEWIKTLTIHRNGTPGFKDYGVPIENIKDTKVIYKGR